jgi:gamma-glutamyltranspeptidase/glutathione hydrolase
MMRDFGMPSRSPVRACNGIVSSANPLASLAGIEILRDGGNAIDAAIGAMAVLGVVESLNLGLGGDCFALYAPGGADRIIAYNGSGRAPAAAEADWYRSHGYTEMPAAGPHSVTVPGAVEAWVRLATEHGTRGLDELLRPAIRYAEDGYPVYDVIASWWRGEVDKLRGDPEAARVLLWNGDAPAAGTIHRQPDLAATLRRIAREGAAGFYTGPVAEAIVQHLRASDGFHTLDDFAAHTGDYVTPISTGYRGYEVYECPPNGQGIAALMMLGLLAGFDLSALDPSGTDRFHLAIEAGRLAILDRDRLVGDPNATKDWRKLLDAEYLKVLRSRIDLAHATQPIAPSPIPMGHDTCHVAVVDRDRNAVSLIASIFDNFGSGLVGPSTGVVLQNRGHGFVLTPNHPNEIGPRKRPLHTIIPALVCRTGRVSHVLGVVGGHYQAWGQAHVITNLVDFGFNVQEALDAPRVFHNGLAVEVERGIDRDVITDLAARQHQIVDYADMNLDRLRRLGGGQLIAIDWGTGALVGAADPRLDGCALGY